jgi:DNA-binding CsgD family transcriptional regulator
LYGSLIQILVPARLGFDDPAELGRAMAARRFDLSRDEIRLLELLAGGLSNKAIAIELNVSELKIKNKLKSLYRKLSVPGRVQAAVVAVEYGFGEHADTSEDNND